MSVIKSNSDGKSRMYLSISKSKICKKHNEPIEGVTETRTNMKGRVVHEEFFDGIQGMLTNVARKSTDFGEFLAITIESEETSIVLDLSLARDARNILNLWKNIDLSKEISIYAFPQQDGEYTKTVVYAKQGGNTVKWYYNKDNTTDNPMPKFPEGYKQMDEKSKKRALHTWKMDMDDAYDDILEEFIKAVDSKPTPAEVKEDLPF